MSPRRDRALGVARPRSAELRSVPSLETVPQNLPAELSSFVGRARELAEIAEALSETRLLTLTGAGGCGKSRLALRTAAEASESFPDGVWWLELAPVTDPRLVAPAVVQALAVRPLPGQSDLEAAVSFLAERRTLIMLDNCEHLLEEAGRVVEALLRTCPMVRVLATSREPLGVAGETNWRVPSLSLPDQTHTGARVDDSDSDAVRLFAERASKVRPRFRVNGVNAATVERICRALDGMPLAIELAAARLRMLSVDQIADGLGDRFRLLTGGGRSALPRHRTLRASVEWSYELLSEQERRLFRRLGVFAGGFTLDAAEHVSAGDGIDREEVLDLLTSLVDKSLVQAEEREHAVRYRLMETVRHYAFEKLGDAGETDPIRDRHRDAYLELSERVQPLTFPPGTFRQLLDPEIANFGQAIEWAAATDPEKALRLCVALIMWWRFRGYFPQGEAAFHRALDAAPKESSAPRAFALIGRAHLFTYSGAIAAAVPAAMEALAEAERTGDPLALAGALLQVGTLTLFPDPIGSRPTLERARQAAVEAGHDYVIMGTTVSLAFSYSHQEDHATARPLFEEIRQLAEDTQNIEMVAWYWLGVAWAEQAAGALDACRDASDRAHLAACDVGDLVTEVSAMGFSCGVDVDQGRPSRALERLLPIRERARTCGGSFTLPLLDEVAARACAANGDLEQARRRFEAMIQEAAGGIASVLSRAHVGLAEVLRLLGAPEDARSSAYQGLEVAERIENHLVGAQAKAVLGRLAAARREWSDCQRLLQEALSAVVDRGYRREVPAILEGLGQVAAGVSSFIEAARIFAAAKTARADLGLVAWKHQRDEVSSTCALVRESIGDAAFDEAFASGEALSIDEAVAYVRRARGARKRPTAGWESLTPTEIEIARHAASGMTNPEIGARMFLSRGTVRTHLSHIYAKLGIKNRAELAAEAARRSSVPTT